MSQSFVSPKCLNNARIKELERKFAKSFPQSFLTGSLIGGDYGLSGCSVGWTIVQAWEPHSAINLKLSEDSTTWIVQSETGDVSKVFEALVQEGFTLSH